MRNLIIGFGILSLLLSACRTNSFTSRKYRSGHYHEKVARANKTEKVIKKEEEQAAMLSKIDLAKNESQLKSEQEIQQKNYRESLIAANKAEKKANSQKVKKAIRTAFDFKSLSKVLTQAYHFQKIESTEKKNDPRLPVSIVSVASALVSLILLFLLLVIDPALVPAVVFYIGGLVFGMVAFVCGILGLSGRKKDKESSGALSKAFSLSGLIYGALLILAYIIIAIMVLLILALFVAIFS